MALPKIVLYTYFRSSASHRVRLALGFKGLEYEARYVNLLRGEQREPAYRALSPTGYLPCLLLGQERFVESTAILELLDEVCPTPSLFPGSFADRARIRALVQVVASGIQPLQNLAVLDRVSADPIERRQWVQHFMKRGLQACNELAIQQDPHGPFAYGGSFSAADAVILPQLAAASRFSVDLAPYERLRTVEAACQTLPFVQKAAPEAQPDAVP